MCVCLNVIYLWNVTVNYKNYRQFDKLKIHFITLSLEFLSKKC